MSLEDKVIVITMVGFFACFLAAVCVLTIRSCREKSQRPRRVTEVLLHAATVLNILADHENRAKRAGGKMLRVYHLLILFGVLFALSMVVAVIVFTVE